MLKPSEDPGQVLLVDKPYGFTSFQIVKKLRYFLGVKKIGHAGTLDPLATGLLILCTGKKTKEINTYQAQEKEYTGTLILGKSTPSIDLETPFLQSFETRHITPALIEQARQKFLGEVEQVPPAYSAIKQEGKRAYELARQGIEVDMRSRIVSIYNFEILNASELPALHFKIVCSKGTYIRSLVRDFALALESGAYLSRLCRTRIGAFSLKDAQSLESFQSLKKATNSK